MSNEVVRKKTIQKKKEKADNKAKQKKLLIIGICAFIILAAIILIFILHEAAEKKGVEIYSYHGQTVELLADGSFNARLAHGVRKNGTYTRTDDNGRISVSFNTNGRIETGWITNDALHIPREWDDGHGHGNVFPKVNEKSRGHHGHH